jgi:hypothetical protein
MPVSGLGPSSGTASAMDRNAAAAQSQPPTEPQKSMIKLMAEYIANAARGIKLSAEQANSGATISMSISVKNLGILLSRLNDTGVENLKKHVTKLTPEKKQALVDSAVKDVANGGHNLLKLLNRNPDMFKTVVDAVAAGEKNRLVAFLVAHLKDMSIDSQLITLKSLGEKLLTPELLASLMADLIPDGQIQTILDSQGGQPIHHLLEAVIKEEVNSTLDEGTLFRSNSVSSKLIGAFFKRLGIPEKCIPKNALDAIDAVKNTDLLKTLQTEASTEALTSTGQEAVALATKVIDALTNQAAVTALPAAVKFIAKSIGKALRGTENTALQTLKSNPDGIAKAIGGVVDLRLRMPALSMRMTDGKSDRNSLLASKIVQTLCNQAPKIKEPELQPVMDTLIKNGSTQKFIDFYTNLYLQYEA